MLNEQASSQITSFEEKYVQSTLRMNRNSTITNTGDLQQIEVREQGKDASKNLIEPIHGFLKYPADQGIILKTASQGNLAKFHEISQSANDTKAFFDSQFHLVKPQVLPVDKLIPKKKQKAQKQDAKARNLKNKVQKTIGKKSAFSGGGSEPLNMQLTHSIFPKKQKDDIDEILMINQIQSQSSNTFTSDRYDKSLRYYDSQKAKSVVKFDQFKRAKQYNMEYMQNNTSDTMDQTQNLYRTKSSLNFQRSKNFFNPKQLASNNDDSTESMSNFSIKDKFAKGKNSKSLNARPTSTHMSGFQVQNQQSKDFSLIRNLVKDQEKMGQDGKMRPQVQTEVLREGDDGYNSNLNDYQDDLRTVDNMRSDIQQKRLLQSYTQNRQLINTNSTNTFYFTNTSQFMPQRGQSQQGAQRIKSLMNIPMSKQITSSQNLIDPSGTQTFIDIQTDSSQTQNQQSLRQLISNTQQEFKVNVQERSRSNNLFPAKSHNPAILERQMQSITQLRKNGHDQVPQFTEQDTLTSYFDSITLDKNSVGHKSHSHLYQKNPQNKNYQPQQLMNVRNVAEHLKSQQWAFKPKQKSYKQLKAEKEAERHQVKEKLISEKLIEIKKLLNESKGNKSYQVLPVKERTDQFEEPYEPPKVVSNYPHRQDLVKFIPNENLISQDQKKKFSQRIDQITKVDVDGDPSKGINPLIYRDKTEIPNMHQRLNQFTAEHLSKVEQCDEKLNQLADDIVFEFTHNTGNMKGRDDIEQEIIEKYEQQCKQNLKKKIVRTVYTGKAPSYYDMTRLNGAQGASGGYGAKTNKYFIDHQKNYITRTGHMINDYAVLKQDDLNELVSYADRKSMKSQCKKDHHQKKNLASKPTLEQIQLKAKNESQQFDIKKFNSQFQNNKYKDLINDNTYKQNLKEQKSAEESDVSSYEMSMTKTESEQPNTSVKIIDPDFLDEHVEKIDIFKRQQSNQDESSNKTVEHTFSREVHEEEYKKFLKKIEVGERINSFSRSYDRLEYLIINRNVDLRYFLDANKIASFCKNKKYVRITQNLTDCQLSNIIQVLRENSPSLCSLHIQNCEIDQRSQRQLSALLQAHQEFKIQNLKQLKLIDCKISQSNLTNITSSLITYEGKKDILQIQPLQRESIGSFDLISDEFDSKAKDTQSDEEPAEKVIKSHNHLQTLVLRGLKLMNQAPIIVKYVQISETLSELDLSFNSMKTKDSEEMLKAILCSKWLKKVNLSHNNLSSIKCFEYVVEIITYSWSLVDLNLSYTQIKNPLEVIHNLQQSSISIQALHFDGIFKTPKELKHACNILKISKDKRNRDVLNRLTGKKPSISPSKKNLSIQGILDKEEIQRDFNRSNDILKSSGLFENNTVDSPSKRDFLPIETNLSHEFRCVFTRYLGNHELQKGWTLKQQCFMCESLQYCLILHYAQYHSSQPSVRVHEKIATKMVNAQDFCLNLGLSIKRIQTCWLEFILQNLQHVNPQIVFDPKLKSIQCEDASKWFIFAEYFPRGPKAKFDIFDGDYSASVVFTPNSLQDQNQALVQVNQNDFCKSLDEIPLHEDHPEDPDSIRYSEFPIHKFRSIIEEIHTQHKLDPQNNLQDFQKKFKPSFKMIEQMDRFKYNKLIDDCIETDYRASKMTAVVDSFIQMQGIEDVLKEFKQIICDVFQYLQAKTKFEEKIYPKVSKQVIEQFLIEFDLISESYNLDELLFKALQSRMQMRAGAAMASISSQTPGEKDSNYSSPKTSKAFRQSNLSFKSQTGQSKGNGLPEFMKAGFKRYQFLEILCRLALFQNEDQKGQTHDIIKKFFQQRLVPNWVQGSQIWIKNEKILNYQNDQILYKHRDLVNTLFEDLKYIYPALTKEQKAKQRDEFIPLLHLVKFFRDENILGDRIQDNSAIFHSFITSKYHQIDDHADEYQKKEIDKQMQALQMQTKLSNDEETPMVAETVMHQSQFEIKIQLQASSKTAAQYEYKRIYPLDSEYHRLSKQEFYEFLIRFSAQAINNEKWNVANCYCWSHFCTLDKFLELISEKMKHQK